MRVLRGPIWLGAAACCLLVSAAAASPSLGRTEPNRAALIVTGADNRVTRMCVFFDEDEISGVDLLERSGLELVTDISSIGTAICKISQHGCASNDCFCRYPTFWGYWNRDRGSDGWHFADAGAVDRKIRNGSMDGWTWGRDGKPMPPKLAFNQVCGSDATNVAATTKRTAAPLSRPRALSNERGNYLTFAGFLVAFVALGFFVRRRRANR